MQKDEKMDPTSDSVDATSANSDATNSGATVTGSEQLTQNLEDAEAKFQQAESGEDDKPEITDGTGSGTRFRPNPNKSRPVKILQPMSGFEKIEARRTGSHKSQGLAISEEQIRSTFGSKVFEYDHRTEVNLILGVGKLTGYVLKTENKRGLYFPASLASEAITLPGAGQVLRTKVKALCIG